MRNGFRTYTSFLTVPAEVRHRPGDQIQNRFVNFRGMSGFWELLHFFGWIGLGGRLYPLCPVGSM